MSNAATPVTPQSCDQLPHGTLSLEQAQAHILASISALTCHETVSVWAAHGRVLAQTVTAPLDVPPHRNAAMDGYALRHTDVVEGHALRVVGSSFAGRPFTGAITSGECVRIMTGASVPDGADSVVMQENVRLHHDGIQVISTLKAGANIRHPGEDLRCGANVLSAGRKLTAADLGLLASLGIGEISVLRRPRVAFCSTGDELRNSGETLQAGDIYDSNRYTLHGMLQQLGVEMIDLGIVRDTPQAVASAFQQARETADVLISSGGVSVGEADFVTSTLQQLGQVNFWKIAIKPGKPLAFGTLGNCFFFGLPGNPVAVMVTFLLLVRPAILKLRGEIATTIPNYTARCTTPLKKSVGRTDFQRGICECDAHGQWQVRSTGGQGSHLLSSMSQANCLIALPADGGNVDAGEQVTIIPFAGLI